MTSAILEILALLTVSCLIGIFFTYRFWKAKCQSLWIENRELTSSNHRLSIEIQALKNKIKALESSLKEATKEVINKESQQATPKRKVNTSDQKLMKKFEEEITLLQEQMGEKEREIEVLSKELEARRVSYYKYIDGKRYKGITIKMADEAIAGKGDGRISMEDAEQIFDTISDGKAYTQVEKDTLRRLRTHYNWTESADELFRKKVRSWAAKGHVLD